MFSRSSAVFISMVLLTACEPSAPPPAASTSQPAASSPPIFADITASSGLDFVHFNGMSGELYFPEMMGAGVALLDYDNDGDLDVYLVQGHMLGPDKQLDDAVYPPPAGAVLTDRLYRNDLKRDGEALRPTFTDVTATSGIKADGYGMGVATGDYDNDGDVDIYVTNFGSNQLWRNEGDGTFLDVTAAAGVDDGRWSVSASFVDYDRDGLLDLYVGNYVDFSFDTHKTCRWTTGAEDYCSPTAYAPEPDSLFRNRGNGAFENISRATGIAGRPGATLGVIAADFNGDGWQDIYVANDGMANFLLINDSDGGFSDEAELAGVAVNMAGSPEASMGVAAADFDRDGDLDLFMTHLTRETNTLYVNDGTGWFEDATAQSGLGKSSFAYTGFGTAWIDYDRDELPDIFIANGAVTHVKAQLLAGDSFPLRQRNQLFRNLGGGVLADISDDAGPVFAEEAVSRGAATGDIDNDGDPDVVVANNSGPAQLLQNQNKTQLPWIGIGFDSSGGNIFGAEVALWRADGKHRWYRTHTDGSYASASDPRIILLPGAGAASADIVVRWPSGDVETWRALATGRYHVLARDAGDSRIPRALKQAP